MSYTVKKLAKLSGVSVRTLHFYDEIGLLKPARYGENGYRYYEEAQLLRLQQILFYRELGFALEQIAPLLRGEQRDQIQSLCAHRQALVQSAERTQVLIRTIDKTIDHLESRFKLKDPAELYWGFDREKQAEHERHIADRFGAATIEESGRRIRDWKPEDFARVRSEYEEIHRQLAQCIEQGKVPADSAVQEVIARHYRTVSLFWSPNRESYTGLGLFYLEHPEFRRLYADAHPKLGEFLVAAMRHYADTELD